MGVRARLLHGRVELARPLGTVVGPMTGMEVAVAVLSDDDGPEGVGYLSFPTTEARDGASSAAIELLDACRSPLGLAAVEQVEGSGQLRTPTMLTRAGASALSQAAWDLTARRLGLPCAALWGGPPQGPQLSCYASGLFLDSSLEELTAEAETFRAAGFPAVKMRVGLRVDDDLARLDAVRSVYSRPGTVAVDAYGGWDTDAARRFSREAGDGLLWIEDPVPLADLVDVGPSRSPLAGGETCWDCTGLTGLARAGIGVLTPDLQFIGGPLRFLAAARTVAALGARVGSHVFPHQSAHLLACLEDPLPLEVLDWWDPLFGAGMAPSAGGVVQPAGPGWGVSLSGEFLAGASTVSEKYWKG